MRAVQSDRDRLRVLLIVGDAEYARAVESSLTGSSRGPWEVETVSDLSRGGKGSPMAIPTPSSSISN